MRRKANQIKPTQTNMEGELAEKNIKSYFKYINMF